MLAHFGRWVPIEELRRICGVSRDGSTAADLVRAARHYGLEAKGWSKSLNGLRDTVLPAILYWEFNHFVVFEGYGRGVWYLNDPANGRRTIGDEKFSQAFTGVLVELTPGPDFETGGAPPGIVRRLWPWLRDVKGTLGYAAACGLLLALPGVVLPVLVSVFVDRVLIGESPSWGPLLAVVAALAGIMVYLLVWLQRRMLRKLAVRLAVEHSEHVISHLFRLPTQFFGRRFAGDLASRIQRIDLVAFGASSQFVGVIIELITSTVFLVLMIVYDPLLAAVVAGIGVVDIALMRLITRRRNDDNRLLLREQSMSFGFAASALRDMDSLRATASEDDFFAVQSGHQARELVARQKFQELGHMVASLPQLLFFLGGAAVLGIGGWRVVSGDMTLGVLMAFYMLAAGFLLPIGRFVQFADAFQILEADLQRIDDVLSAPVDPSLESSEHAERKVATVRGRLRLSGHIEVRDLTFGYRPNRAPLVENLSLTIEPGQRIAVIGPTGSGKSTVLKLISGEYEPWSGEILFDGVPRRDIPRSVLTRSLAVVDQQILLFAGTVRENLTLWNPTVPDRRVVAAAADALLHEEIMGRVGGYDSLVEEEGRNFSGGQRQRAEIARALVGDPSMLFLDEATSALDAVTETLIDDRLRRRGCTCFMVAHRLSTIRDCDQIIVMEKGQAVQRGIHQDLVTDEHGLYTQLIGAQ